jgi:hypothetical protein
MDSNSPIPKNRIFTRILNRSALAGWRSVMCLAWESEISMSQEQTLPPDLRVVPSRGGGGVGGELDLVAAVVLGAIKGLIGGLDDTGFTGGGEVGYTDAAGDLDHSAAKGEANVGDRVEQTLSEGCGADGGSIGAKHDKFLTA